MSGVLMPPREQIFQLGLMGGGLNEEMHDSLECTDCKQTITMLEPDIIVELC